MVLNKIRNLQKEKKKFPIKKETFKKTLWFHKSNRLNIMSGKPAVDKNISIIKSCKRRKNKVYNRIRIYQPI